MVQWIEVKTLGMHSACYSHKGSLKIGENIMGFRAMEDPMVLKISHVLWQ